MFSSLSCDILCQEQILGRRRGDCRSALDSLISLQLVSSRGRRGQSAGGGAVGGAGAGGVGGSGAVRGAAGAETGAVGNGRRRDSKLRGADGRC